MDKRTIMDCTNKVPLKAENFKGYLVFFSIGKIIKGSSFPWQCKYPFSDVL